MRKETERERKRLAKLWPVFEMTFSQIKGVWGDNSMEDNISKDLSSISQSPSTGATPQLAFMAGKKERAESSVGRHMQPSQEADQVSARLCKGLSATASWFGGGRYGQGCKERRATIITCSCRYSLSLTTMSLRSKDRIQREKETMTRNV